MSISAFFPFCKRTQKIPQFASLIRHSPHLYCQYWVGSIVATEISILHWWCGDNHVILGTWLHALQLSSLPAPSVQKRTMSLAKFEPGSSVYRTDVLTTTPQVPCRESNSNLLRCSPVDIQTDRFTIQTALVSLSAVREYHPMLAHFRHFLIDNERVKRMIKNCLSLLLNKNWLNLEFQNWAVI